MPHTSGASPKRALGDYVIEKHCIHTTRNEIGVRVDIVVIRDGNHAVTSLCVEKQLISSRRAECRDFSMRKIRQLSVTSGIGRSNGEHFAELEVWK